MHNYKNLIAWKRAVNLSITIYKITSAFPEHEKFSLTSQIRRACVSIPSNIAEGSKRSTKKDFKHFLTIASGSGAEVETQLYIARQLGYLKEEEYTTVAKDIDETMKIITTLIKKFE
jgi:four helix bundle protein